MLEQDLTGSLQQQLVQATTVGKPLAILGGGSKAFYGGVCQVEEMLNIGGHSGVIAYDPSELVITARAGSRLKDICEILADRRQMLGFEPPYFGESATLGGTLACGFSGPRRPFVGSARDFVLGCKILNGRGELMSFGGQVMKNVAGFDVSRLMVGALGTLGVILEVSLRVTAMPEFEQTTSYQLSEEQALRKMNELSAQPWPLSALAYDGERMWLRLSGAEAAVQAAIRQIGGDIECAGECFWRDLREQTLPFFNTPGDLWRISVAPSTSPMDLPGRYLLDWGGALRWLKTDLPAEVVHNAAQQAGGYAVRFRSDDKQDWLRLDASLLSLQQNIRKAFDPLGLFNPGRLWT